MKRGTRVYLKDASPRNVGTIESIMHRVAGTLVCVRWDNGWHSTIAADDLAIAEPAEHATECDLMRRAIDAEHSR